jgi:hypothetical protein
MSLLLRQILSTLSHGMGRPANGSSAPDSLRWSKKMVNWQSRILLSVSLIQGVWLEGFEDACHVSIGVSGTSGESDSSDIWYLDNGIEGHWSSGNRLAVIDGSSVLLILAVYGCHAAEKEEGCSVILEAKGQFNEPYFRNEDHMSWLSPVRILPLI